MLVLEDWNDGTGATYVNSSDKNCTVNICKNILCIFLLRYYKEETQPVKLFFTKGVPEFVVKVLDKYANKEFLKIPF